MLRNFTESAQWFFIAKLVLTLTEKYIVDLFDFCDYQVGYWREHHFKDKPLCYKKKKFNCFLSNATNALTFLFSILYLQEVHFYHINYILWSLYLHKAYPLKMWLNRLMSIIDHVIPFLLILIFLIYIRIIKSTELNHERRY